MTPTPLQLQEAAPARALVMGLPRSWLIVGAVIAGVVMLGVHVGVEEPLPWWIRLIGATPGLLAIAAIYLYVRRGDFATLPFLPFALLQIYFYWGFPTLTFSRVRQMPVSDDAVASGLTAILVMLVVMLAVYPLGKFLGALVRPGLERVTPSTIGPAIGLMVIPWSILVVMVHAGLDDWVPESLRYPVAIVGSPYPLLTLLIFRAEQRGRPVDRLYYLGLIAALAAGGLFRGMLDYVARPFLAAGALYLVVRRRLPLRLVLVLGVLLVILQPAKLAYRRAAWDESRRTQQGLEGAASKWGQALSDSWTQDQSQDNLELMATRLNELEIIAVTFDLCPNVIPFDRGQKWGYIPASLVPRFLWPGKPNFTDEFNDRFSVIFGFQSKMHVRESTAAFPLLSDGWWNYGWWGVVAVGVMLGVLLGLLQNAFSSSSWSVTSVALFFFTDLRPTEPVISQLGGLPQTLVAAIALSWLVWLVSLGFQRRAPTAARAPA